MATFFGGSVNGGRVRSGDGFLNRLIVAGTLDQHTGRGVTGLTGVVEAADDALLYGFRVSIGKNQVGTFAAQFQRNPLDGLRTGDSNGATRACGAGEADHVHVFVRGKLAAYARAGVDRISIGALTHSAPALDLSLLTEVVD